MNKELDKAGLEAAAHVTKTVTDADWDALNRNSLETDCLDCGNYYTMEWKEGNNPPQKLICPSCGSSNHGCVGSPAGGMHLALHDARLP